MKTLMVGLIAWGIAGAAQAQDWVVGASTDGGMMGFDQANIRVNGDIRTAHTVVVFPSTEMHSSGAFFDYIIAQERFDCAEERSAVLTLSGYKFSSSERAWTERNDGTEWIYHVADSVGHDLLKAVCATAPQETVDLRSAHDFAVAGREFFEGR